MEKQINIEPNEVSIGERVYALLTTSEYNGDNSPFGVMVISAVNREDFEPYGLNERDINEVVKLDIGEIYNQSDYGNSAIIIRLA